MTAGSTVRSAVVVSMIAVTSAAPPRSNHTDTVHVKSCVDLGFGMPDFCIEGSANVCTRDISLRVNVTTAVLGTVSVPLELGDGTDKKVGAPTCLSGVLPSNLGCTAPCFHVKDVTMGTGGLQGCIEFRLDCSASLLPFSFQREMTCVEFGEGPSACTETDKCSCLAHKECGWCPSSNSCTRLLPNPSVTDPLARDLPACSCASGVVLHNDSDALMCSPSLPPPSPAPPPPPAPSPVPRLPPPMPSSDASAASADDSLPSWAASINGDGDGAFFFSTAWLLWLPCAFVGVAAYLGFGLCGLAEAKKLRRTDMLSLAGTRSSSGMGNGGGSNILQFLPARIQFAAGAACTQLDETELLWAGQPILLAAAVAPFALWAVSMLSLGVLNAQLEEANSKALGMALVLLPVPLTLPLLVLLRRTQGTLYLLTARGAAVLKLQCAYGGRRDAPRRTRYTQMLAQPVVRRRAASALCAGRLNCADLLFASSPTGGELGFLCLSAAVASSLQLTLREKVAVAATPDGGVVLQAIVSDASINAVAVEVQDAGQPSSSSGYAPPLSKPPTVHYVEAHSA